MVFIDYGGLHDENSIKVAVAHLLPHCPAIGDCLSYNAQTFHRQHYLVSIP